MPKATPPFFNGNAFDCPSCGVHSSQQWCEPLFIVQNVVRVPASDRLAPCRCLACTNISVWVEREIVHPRLVVGDSSNPDLPAEIARDFEEARRIAVDSPRGAAALLRLAIQKLCAHLGEPTSKVNDAIAALVTKGLPVQVQQALDIVRVVGNNAVHPGTLDLADDLVTVTALFKLVNVIAEDRISRPNHVAALYSSLPEGARAAIAKRDSKA